ANRLGASALMQGLSDGYFIAPATVSNYIAQTSLSKVDASHSAFQQAEEEVVNRVNRLLNIRGRRSVDEIHRELGKIMWEYCGMGRTEAGLKKALELIPALREEFWQNASIPGDADDMNQTLEKAGRVADFLELGELLCRDALDRAESCGGHFREESQTEDGEALRDDENFAYVAAWQYAGDDAEPILNKEPLKFDYVKLTQRSYK
ncbi:MAG: fumarate reductase/succinate dehydrogenase flavoprotein subunit, partial [Caldilineaceae bacterium]|nr:fumarate reductase/succinate dehydrogenase flavoprotein subunit [Caldilineaceae bacterium]